MRRGSPAMGRAVPALAAALVLTAGAAGAGAQEAAPAPPAGIHAGAHGADLMLGYHPRTLPRERGAAAPGSANGDDPRRVAFSPPTVQEADTSGVSPGGAFLRSLLVPGWGHAAVGAYGRGSFYFVGAGATGWMLAKTAHFRGAAEHRRSLVRAQIVDDLVRRGTTDPDSLISLVEADERMEAAQELVDSRSQQMEDWTAFGVFWLFLTAADAFVSAHLMDFPTPLDIRALPSGAPGRAGVRLRVSVPVGGPPPP